MACAFRPLADCVTEGKNKKNKKNGEGRGLIPERIQHNILVHINGSRIAWRSVSTCSVQAHFWMGMDGLSLAEGFALWGFSGVFQPFLGTNLNISLLISDVIPPYRQVVMPSSAETSAQQPEPRQKQVSLGQECDFLSFVTSIETGAIPARVPPMCINSRKISAVAYPVSSKGTGLTRDRICSGRPS